MKWILAVLMAGVALFSGAPLRAEAPKSSDNAAVAKEASGVEIRPSEIKRPEDFAPPEQIVSGRDTTDFRKDGTFLARASREIPKVDGTELLERKYAMYEGRRFYGGPQRSAAEADSPRVAAVRRKLAAATAGAPEGRSLGWLGWTLLTAIVSAVLVAWRMGWFVPFSARAEAKRRTSRAASGTPGNREAEGPQIELIRRR